LIPFEILEYLCNSTVLSPLLIMSISQPPLPSGLLFFISCHCGCVITGGADKTTCWSERRQYVMQLALSCSGKQTPFSPPITCRLNSWC